MRPWLCRSASWTDNRLGPVYTVSGEVRSDEKPMDVTPSHSISLYSGLGVRDRRLSAMSMTPMTTQDFYLRGSNNLSGTFPSAGLLELLRLALLVNWCSCQLIHHAGMYSITPVTYPV